MRKCENSFILRMCWDQSLVTSCTQHKEHAVDRVVILNRHNIIFSSYCPQQCVSVRMRPVIWMCAPTMDTACCLHNELSLHYTGGNSLSHCYTIWILRVKVILICLCICLTSNSIIPEYKISKYMCMHHFSLPCAGAGVSIGRIHGPGDTAEKWA